MTPLNPAIRIEHVEDACARLSATEPPVDAYERARLFRQIGDIERRLASLSLQLIVAEPDPDALDESLRRCERRVEELAMIWSQGANEELLAG